MLVLKEVRQERGKPTDTLTEGFKAMTCSLAAPGRNHTEKRPQSRVACDYSYLIRPEKFSRSNKMVDAIKENDLVVIKMSVS